MANHYRPTYYFVVPYLEASDQFVATNDLSTDVERCIEMRLPDEDRSADEQRAGRGGRPEAVTLGPLYPLPEVRNGLLKSN